LIILDIETVPREDLSQAIIEERERLIKEKFDKIPDNIVKEETIEKRRVQNAIKAKEAIIELREKDAVDIDYAQICAIGFCTDKDWKVKVGTVEKQSELELLLKFDKALEDEYGPIVTFNGDHFDIPILKRRFMLKNLMVPTLLTLGRNSTIDMMDQLKGHWRSEPKKQDEYALAFGFYINKEYSDGYKVLQKYRDNDFNWIKEHLKQDVRILRDLFMLTARMGFLRSSEIGTELDRIPNPYTLRY